MTDNQWPEWRAMEDHDGSSYPVLLFANIPPVTDADGLLLLGYNAPQMVSGYWDAVDEAWCTTVSTVFGPFVEPLFWMPLPPFPGWRAPNPQVSETDHG